VKVSNGNPTDVLRHRRLQDQQAEEATKRDAQDASDLRLLMEVDWGRRFMCWLLHEMGHGSQVFHANAMTMAQQAGLRDMSSRLVRSLESDLPDLYHLMLLERDDGNA
jgi:hypothetical protein